MGRRGVMAQLPGCWLDVLDLPGAGLGVQRHESLSTLQAKLLFASLLLPGEWRSQAALGDPDGAC